MAKFVKTVQNFAFQYNLWQNDSKIIVGVSGGADSACLLDLLVLLKGKYNFKLHVAHVNYGLRGKDSDKDEFFVKKICENYGLKLTILRPKKAKYLGNLENVLRDIRYDFFEKLRIENNFDIIAVAHNCDDQAETVLMRTLRGSGLNGLASMRPKTNNIIRPLLLVSKIEIITYLKEKKLTYRNDKTNNDIKFLRSRIRHKLIPYLEKNFNVSIKNILTNWALSVADDYDYMLSQGEIFSFIACTNSNIKFSATNFLKEHLAIQRQIIRRVISNLKKNTKDVESANIEELLKIIKSTKSKNQKATFRGLNICKKGDIIEIFC